MTINSYSWFDLVAAFLGGCLAIRSLLRGRRAARSRADALCSIMALCVFAFLLTAFLADNIVPEGLPAASVKDGPARAVLNYRLAFAAGALFGAAALHFACEITGRIRLVGWRLAAYHLGTATFCALLFLTPLIEVSEEPIVRSPSWNAVIPWRLAWSAGPLAIFGVLLAAHGGVHLLVWNALEPRAPGRTRLAQGQMIRAGLAVVTLAWVMIAMESATGYAGISGAPYVLLFGMYTVEKGMALHPTHEETPATERA